MRRLCHGDFSSVLGDGGTSVKDALLSLSFTSASSLVDSGGNYSKKKFHCAFVLASQILRSIPSIADNCTLHGVHGCSTLPNLTDQQSRCHNLRLFSSIILGL